VSLPSSNEHRAAPAVAAGDDLLVRALREGDEATFARLLDAWGPLMLRMAQFTFPAERWPRRWCRRRG
jgi:hypothetical protein